MTLLFAMDTVYLAKLAGDSAYGWLTLNGLWGVYCAIVIWRRLNQFRFRDEAEQNEFMGELQQHLLAGDFQAAAQLCEDDKRALPQLAALAIANRDAGLTNIKRLLSDRFQRDIMADLEYRVSWVVTVIKSGPLLGLFGTVLGMMAAFGRIGTGEKVNPSQIADEISIALICTAMGLATAIPLTYVVSTINIRIRKFQDLVSWGLTQMLETFNAISV
jgi:biopolymer transport protein ExbB/TolQ